MPAGFHARSGPGGECAGDRRSGPAALAGDVRRLEFVLRHDPTRLAITVARPAAVLAGASVLTDLSVRGMITVRIDAPALLQAGRIVLLSLAARRRPAGGGRRGSRRGADGGPWRADVPGVGGYDRPEISAIPGATQLVALRIVLDTTVRYATRVSRLSRIRSPVVVASDAPLRNPPQCSEGRERPDVPSASEPRVRNGQGVVGRHVPLPASVAGVLPSARRIGNSAGEHVP